VGWGGKIPRVREVLQNAALDDAEKGTLLRKAGKKNVRKLRRLGERRQQRVGAWDNDDEVRSGWFGVGWVQKGGGRGKMRHKWDWVPTRCKAVGHNGVGKRPHHSPDYLHQADLQSSAERESWLRLEKIQSTKQLEYQLQIYRNDMIGLSGIRV
jgi:hypothetical protein